MRLRDCAREIGGLSGIPCLLIGTESHSMDGSGVLEDFIASLGPLSSLQPPLAGSLLQWHSERVGKQEEVGHFALDIGTLRQFFLRLLYHALETTLF